ncbi:MAG: glycosyltransferase family 4 protein [Saccharospirillaceae bacterium]|nr:glycosyltransferase family 4 protein [Saccharospirillaceae bacterium]
MKKILIFTKYDNKGASSRLRLIQYIDFLENNNCSVEYKALFTDEYLDTLYSSNKRPFSLLIKCYFKRLLDVVFCSGYDVVFIEKELFPHLPSCFEWLFYIKKIPYILDYDDAIFHNYDLSNSKLVRFVLQNKLHGLIKNASHINVGNNYLADYVKCFKSDNIHYLPTVIDINRYEKLDRANQEQFVIGWIGSPSTTKYLEIIREPLRQLSLKYNIKLRTIGASSFQDTGFDIEQLEWVEELESQHLNGIDVGIMPLENTQWEQGKCGYKLIQYMACGKPVIASPVGVNVDIVTDEIGFLCRTPAEWLTCFEKLIMSQTLSVQMGHQARLEVESKYNIAVCADIMIDQINELVS